MQFENLCGKLSADESMSCPTDIGTVQSTFGQKAEHHGMPPSAGAEPAGSKPRLRLGRGSARREQMTQDPISAANELRHQVLRAVSEEVQSWKIAQGEAALRLGTDRVALNRLLHGKRTPSLQALLEFANAANMTFRFTLEDTTGTLVAFCGEPRSAHSKDRKS